MPLASVIGGAPFRASLYALALFVAVLAGTGTLLHHRLAATMYGELEAQVSAELVLFRAILDRGGRAALIEAIADMERLAVAGPRLGSLFDDDGTPLAGHLDVAPDIVGWRTLTVTRRQGEDTADYRARTERWHIGTIVIGHDTRVVRRALAALARYLALAGVAVSIACLAVGYVLGSATRERLDEMESALDRVAHGDMRARLPLDGGDAQLERVARRINGHLDELAVLMGSTRNTIRSVAHDLRTPLNRASIRLQEAALAIGQDSPALDQIDAASREIDSLGEICETILRISRIRTSDERHTFERVSLGELITEAAETYEPLLEDGGQRLAVMLEPHADLVVRADRRMLRQLLANLVSNAIRHCPAGTLVTLQGSREADGRVALEIADSGPGIPLSERVKVLEPFHRLDASRSSEGSGLGLALVDAIVRHHRAELRLEDNEPGLRVIVRFATGT